MPAANKGIIFERVFNLDDVGWSLVLMGVLAVLSLFFSVNTSALRGFSRVRLQDAFKALGKEQQAEQLVSVSETLIWGCSFFRVLVNICILFLLISVLADKGEGPIEAGVYLAALLLAVAFFTVFGLAIPYAWAKYAGEKILARTFCVLRFISLLAWPVVMILKAHDLIVKRLGGVQEAGEDENQEELLSAVEQSRMEGVVDEEEKEMIESVLELSETTVDEILTPRTDVVAIDIEADLQNIIETVSREGHSRIPVYQDNIDNIIGLIYAKDLLELVGKKPEGFKLKDKLRKAYFVPETKSLRELLHEFQSQKLHIAVVLDEYGGTAGIVTIEDILEELVGEITDEYEELPKDSLNRIDENIVEIDARMYIDDFNSELDVELPEDEDYDTVGGFVFSHLGSIPKTGQVFDYENLVFTVKSATPRKIERIRVEKRAEQENSKQ